MKSVLAILFLLIGTVIFPQKFQLENKIGHFVNASSFYINSAGFISGDLDLECRKYEALIQRFGGIDLQLLGIGKAGHIGFNEPLTALRSRTRVKALTPTTIKQNAPLFGGEDKMPRRAITMGVGTILECRRCLLLATGDSKAKVVAQAVEGPITSLISGKSLLDTLCVHGPEGDTVRE